MEVRQHDQAYDLEQRAPLVSPTHAASSRLGRLSWGAGGRGVFQASRVGLALAVVATAFWALFTLDGSRRRSASSLPLTSSPVTVQKYEAGQGATLIADPAWSYPPSAAPATYQEGNAYAGATSGYAPGPAPAPAPGPAPAPYPNYAAPTTEPFDCSAGLQNWQMDWSNNKKAWCCQYKYQGCETTAPATAPAAPVQGYAGPPTPAAQAPPIVPIPAASTPPPSTTLPPATTPPVVTTPPPPPCGLVEEDVDYPGNDLRAILNVTSPEPCCQECAQDFNCVAWTWGKKRGEVYSDGCFLKGGHPRGQLTRVKNPMFTSGQPTQVGRSIPVIPRQKGQSLFCFSLMLPKGYERGLLERQYTQGWSIFGCDEYAVYSNLTIKVAPGVFSIAVNVDLTCDVGGEFKTALNTDIFMAVWARILEDGRFQLHDWTVKVDPDAVFLSARLRAVLTHYEEPEEGIYLNNCKMGMHGPIEVFSRKAVLAWDNNRQRCVDHFTKLCSGPCLWGEDMFIDQCLQKVAKVKRVLEPLLLIEEHCKPPTGWKDCRKDYVVSFHPFKDWASYKGCVGNAASGAA